MLIGIDPLLGPELLAVLRAMGHGDEIAIVDGNYPAQAHARRLVRADGLGLEPVLAAVVSVLPLDADVARPAARACNPVEPDIPHAVHQAMDRILQRALGRPERIEVTHGPAFYDRVKNCYAVIATSEPALFANVILRKGVVAAGGSDAPDLR